MTREPYQFRLRVDDGVPHRPRLECRPRPILEACRPQEQPDGSRPYHRIVLAGNAERHEAMLRVLRVHVRSEILRLRPLPIILLVSNPDLHILRTVAHEI
jgi:hypothetical protein